MPARRTTSRCARSRSRTSTGMTPRPDYSAVCFNLIPTVGEYFVFPALTTSGPCEIMVFEGIPGGPMDCWGDVTTPERAPREVEVDPRDVHALGGGALPRRRADRPERHPRRALPADGAEARRGAARRGGSCSASPTRSCSTTRSPGQGSNNASQDGGRVSRARSRRTATRPYDRAFMERTFERFWDGYGQFVTTWTNALLVAAAGARAEAPRRREREPAARAPVRQRLRRPARLLRVVHGPGQGRRVPRRGGRGGVVTPPDRDRRRRPVRAAARARTDGRRPRGDARLGPQRGRGRLRPGPVEPVHVRDVARDGARARPRLLARGVPAGRGHRAGAAVAGRERQGTRLGGAARRAGAVGRPAGQAPGLARGAGEARRHVRRPRGGHRRPRAVRTRARPRARRHRQGLARRPLPARRREVAVRHAAARARADVRARARAAAGALRGLLQHRPRRRRVLRLPRADDLGPVRDHGLRGHPRRADGLLGRRARRRSSTSRGRSRSSSGFCRGSTRAAPTSS